MHRQCTEGSKKPSFQPDSSASSLLFVLSCTLQPRFPSGIDFFCLDTVEFEDRTT